MFMPVTTRCIKLIWLICLLSIITACSSTQDVDIPVADDVPNLTVFCNNDSVPCFELSDTISPYLATRYGEDVIGTSYFFVSSPLGARIFDELELSELPSYVIFDENKNEVFRHEGEIELEQLEAVFSELLSLSD